MDVVPDPLPNPRPPARLFGATGQTEPMGRDQAAYAALVALIDATGAFREVIHGDSLRRGQSGADGFPLAVVTPKGWEESDDFDPVQVVRRASFLITVAVKAQDGDSPFDELDLLASTIQDAVDGSDLLGTTLPALTKIRSGRFGQSDHYPERTIELDGGFATLIDPGPNA